MDIGEEEFFSLEDDDYSGLFITQSDRNDEEMEQGNGEVDLASQNYSEGCVEGVEGGMATAVYSDISDPEDDFLNLWEN